MGFWGLSCHTRSGRRRKGREGKEGGRKGEIEMGHLGHWGLSCHRRRRRKGSSEEGRGRLRWDIWDTGA